MDAFESLIETLLRRSGYWTRTSFKVDLTQAEKRLIGRPSTPRWEIDIVAFKGGTNEILAVECKSYLHSRGVVFRDGEFEPPNRYKLFTDRTLRRVVLNRLRRQLLREGAVPRKPSVKLCLAAGRIATCADRGGLAHHMSRHRWRLFDEEWIRQQLGQVANADYENDVAHVVAKLTLQPGQRQHSSARRSDSPNVM